MKIDDAQKYASIIQSIVVILAVAVGGIWAVFQFGAKKEADKAAADLAKVETELKSMEKQLKGDANIDIEVVAKQVCSDQRERFFIDARVTLVNRGTRSALFDFSSPRDSGLFAAQVSVQPNGLTLFTGTYQPQLYTFDPARPAEPTALGVHDIQPGVTSKLRYWIPVPSAGLYLVSFVAPMSKTDREVAQDRLKKENSTYAPSVWRWQGRDYVVVAKGFCK